jgi:hypothetical protein
MFEIVSRAWPSPKASINFTRNLMLRYLNKSESERLARLLAIVEDHGGGLRVDGQISDVEGVLAGMSCIDDHTTIEMQIFLLQCAVDIMRARQLPNQYIPEGEGDAPWLDFKIDCDKGDAQIASKWSRRATPSQKNWD